MVLTEKQVRLLKSLPHLEAEELFYLGEYHSFNEDFTMARQCFHRAIRADPTNGKALLCTAQLYELGFGLEEDRSQAERLYERAVPLVLRQLKEDPDDAHAQYYLGLFYYGRVTRSNESATSFWTRASLQGHVFAQDMLADSLETGDDAEPQDFVKAVGWRAQAARQGSADSRRAFECLFRHVANLVQKLKRRAAKRNDFLAASALAYLYATGIPGCVRRNPALAQKWKQRSLQCSKIIPQSWSPRLPVPRQHMRWNNGMKLS